MTTNNNIKSIDGCMDGWDCPDAELCNEHSPESCPLIDNQFDIDRTDPVDMVMYDA
jgi:hypothetical protein